MNRAKVLKRFAGHVQKKYSIQEVMCDVFASGDPFERLFSDPTWRTTVKLVFLNADLLFIDD